MDERTRAEVRELRLAVESMIRYLEALRPPLRYGEVMQANYLSDAEAHARAARELEGGEVDRG